MPQYQFVVKETPQGKADHDKHLHRREVARQKGHVMGAERQGEVVETYEDGFGCYTWVVDAPSRAILDDFIKECERHGFVKLSSGPTLLDAKGV